MNFFKFYNERINRSRFIGKRVYIKVKFLCSGNREKEVIGYMNFVIL